MTKALVDIRHIPDYEKEVIIRLITEPTIMRDLYSLLTENDFWTPKFKIAFSIMRKFYEDKQAWDLLIVQQELKKKDLMISEFLDEQRTFSVSEVLYVAKELRDATLKRRLVETAMLIKEDKRSGQDVLVDTISRLSTLNKEQAPPMDLSSIVSKHKTIMEQRYSGIITGISTGFKDLDIMLGNGFQKSDLILIGARPSIGKTSLALTLAYNAAKAGHKSLFLSVEMRDQDIMDRLLSFESGLSCTHIIRGKADKAKIEEAYKRIEALPLSIVEVYKATSSDVFTVASREKYSKDTEIVFVDYLQYLGDDPDGNSESVRIGRISRNLKNLAGVLQVAVVAPTQLNRKSESRGGDAKGTPQLHDLRESGNLEQDADVVMLLSRDPMGKKPEDTRLHIAKNRKGETGKITMVFNTLTTRFEQ